VANIFRTISTKCYHNRPDFVDDVTETFGMFFGLQLQLLFTYKTRKLTLFTWAGKRLSCCIPNLFRIMCTKSHQNRLRFVEDMTKTFWSVFSVHSV